MQCHKHAHISFSHISYIALKHVQLTSDRVFTVWYLRCTYSLFIAFCESYTSTQGSEQWQCVHSPYDLQPTHHLLQVLAAACGLALPTGPALSSGTEPGKDQHKGFVFVSGENSFFAPKCQILQKPKPSRVISIFHSHTAFKYTVAVIFAALACILLEILYFLTSTDSS